MHISCTNILVAINSQCLGISFHPIGRLSSSHFKYPYKFKFYKISRKLKTITLTCSVGIRLKLTAHSASHRTPSVYFHYTKIIQRHQSIPIYYDFSDDKEKLYNSHDIAYCEWDIHILPFHLSNIFDTVYLLYSINLYTESKIISEK